MVLNRNDQFPGDEKSDLKRSLHLIKGHGVTHHPKKVTFAELPGYGIYVYDLCLYLHMLINFLVVNK